MDVKSSLEGALFFAVADSEVGHDFSVRRSIKPLSMYSCITLTIDVAHTGIQGETKQTANDSSQEAPAG